ncbi:MAG: NusA-like transcription termination signal-binding factor [Candidatus Altiarchaeales archaeon]|nr:NusA-like transcription termination signal-binding factor [Candidatus Altiarchaeota archaeon]MBU4341829.1 NusA-like transcription termination signal-binding factor [Candidatus Altiarchaeota archaeon]MBU4437815.1 NusA-like transcription termination signal-binding factor [Candidatus Altiarchaeota archaeon]MCG2782443.1 NusA-like transcription termination signal-binding factor [Candidatus Altiarchaeales archaeon]
MSRIRLGSEEIRYMTIFENLTGAGIKDCVHSENIMGFLVNQGDMGLAIGKSGSNIEKVRKATGREILVMEFSDDATEFVRNLFQPIKVRRIKIHSADNEKVAIVEVNRNDRKKVIGHGGHKIKIAKSLASRHHNINDIKIKTL